MARRTDRRERVGNGLTTALLYRRVSSDEQANDGLSLPAQMKACQKYVADHEGWHIGNEYEDILSGKRDDRPAYQELLAQTRQLTAQGKSVAVVVLRLDRFGRRLKERVNVWEEFKEMGVQVHSIREGGHVNDMMYGM